jgi:hypothetical protein
VQDGVDEANPAGNIIDFHSTRFAMEKGLLCLGADLLAEARTDQR